MLPMANRTPPVNSEMRCQSWRAVLGTEETAMDGPPTVSADVMSVRGIWSWVMMLLLLCSGVLDTVYPCQERIPVPVREVRIQCVHAHENTGRAAPRHRRHRASDPFGCRRDH